MTGRRETFAQKWGIVIYAVIVLAATGGFFLWHFGVVPVGQPTAVGEPSQEEDDRKALALPLQSGDIPRDILTGAMAGLITTGVWGLGYLVYMLVKDITIRNAFRRNIQRDWAFGESIEWFVISVSNRTSWPVTVRSVWLADPDLRELPFIYRGNIAPSYSTHILLKSGMRGLWYLPMEGAPEQVVDGGVEIEYDSPLGAARRLRCRLHPKHLGVVKQHWERSVKMRHRIIVPAEMPVSPEAVTSTEDGGRFEYFG
jgi:hypothetical protein